MLGCQLANQRSHVGVLRAVGGCRRLLGLLLGLLLGRNRRLLGLGLGLLSRCLEGRLGRMLGRLVAMGLRVGELVRVRLGVASAADGSGGGGADWAYLVLGRRGGVLLLPVAGLGVPRLSLLLVAAVIARRFAAWPEPPGSWSAARAWASASRSRSGQPSRPIRPTCRQPRRSPCSCQRRRHR